MTLEKSDIVLKLIMEWSLGRPLWQRDVLRRIITKGTLDENQLSETFEMCKAESGLIASNTSPEPLSEEHLPLDRNVGESVRIAGISNVKGVNQLASDQTLEFETNGISVVYGANGTGKSGYSRILKKACRSRHIDEIVSNVNEPPQSHKATATISFIKGDNTPTRYAWEDNGPECSDLSSVIVFDRESAVVHARKKNEVWFHPFGLDIIHDLSKAWTYIRNNINREILAMEREQNSMFRDPEWSQQSWIGSLMSSLKRDSDLTPLRNVPKLTESNKRRQKKLALDLSSDNSDSVALLFQDVARLRQLAKYLELIEKVCSDVALQQLLNLETKVTSARKIEAHAKQKLLNVGHRSVGTRSWNKLWQSALRHSQTLDEETKFPPSEGGSCVLCQQSIDVSAAEHMERLDTLSNLKAIEEANKAEDDLMWHIQRLSTLNIHVAEVSLAFDYLRENDPGLGECVLRFVTAARLRQESIIGQIGEVRKTKIEELPICPSDLVNQVAESISEYANVVSGGAGTPDYNKLIREYENLVDQERYHTKGFYEIAVTEVRRLEKIGKLNACLAQLEQQAIAEIGDAIADKVVTPIMDGRFASEIETLAGQRVRAVLQKSNQTDSSPRYEVRLVASQVVELQNVLSEGEQTCVALAAYFTELANARHKSALVFDDPTTSLDHRWREKVIKRLVREASERQIIVFTHDVVFLNDLLREADMHALPVGLCHLSRGSHGVGVVSNELPWRTSRVNERLSKLERDVRKAEKMYESGKEEAYLLLAYSIYDRLRATLERSLEEIVFANVILRYRDYINPRELMKVTALCREDVENFKLQYSKCCDYIQSHDSSSVKDSTPPDPPEILKDIETTKLWVNNLKERMKSL